jgi:hypothetical protein
MLSPLPFLEKKRRILKVGPNVNTFGNTIPRYGQSQSDTNRPVESFKGGTRMSSGDSHTGFSSGSFTAGALSGAGLLAGAFVGTMQAVVQANREACARWTHDELKEAYNLSELLRFRKCEELAELQEENERLRLLVKSATARPSRGQAR